MNNSKSPWDIIGWGIIIAFIIRALPLILGFLLIFWLLGGFGVLADMIVIVVGSLSLFWCIDGPLYEKCLGDHPTKEHEQRVQTAFVILYALVLGFGLSYVWWGLVAAVAVLCLLALVVVWT